MSAPVYAWPSGPGWSPSRWEMRVIPNTRSFVSPYTNSTQVADLFGDRWAVSLDLPPDVSSAIGAQREAFFDRLKGQWGLIALPNLQRLAPRGTLRGTPTLLNAVAQFANTAIVQASAGETLLAADLIGIGGQLVRNLVDATADGSGHIAIEFAPRIRIAQAIGATVTWNAPTANFMLKDGSTGVPTAWRPGNELDGCSFELVEAL